MRTREKRNNNGSKFLHTRVGGTSTDSKDRHQEAVVRGIGSDRRKLYEEETQEKERSRWLL